MKLEAVQSSLIEALGYDPATRKLRVKFKKGGAEYDYLDVAPDLVAELMSAPSQGQFFLLRIKGAGFEYRKVTA